MRADGEPGLVWRWGRPFHPVCALGSTQALSADQGSNFESFPSVPWTITEQPPTVPPGTTLWDRLPLINGSACSEAYLLP
ncbi:hypothetical protein GCM10010221_54380 [Streptomyces parvus]|uniref:hypothetical protein n=1 Tax=Streptomyces parvus TaxID=66428 RepID=UPI0019BA8E6C|nr:hypothetical protein [Streptomyces parvus]GGS48340.1 hypothetical protein GCM10010221_54380 [Streptomyces parvus]